jgi:hypothetical protein
MRVRPIAGAHISVWRKCIAGGIGRGRPSGASLVTLVPVHLDTIPGQAQRDAVSRHVQGLLAYTPDYAWIAESLAGDHDDDNPTERAAGCSARTYSNWIASVMRSRAARPEGHNAATCETPTATTNANTSPSVGMMYVRL